MKWYTSRNHSKTDSQNDRFDENTYKNLKLFFDEYKVELFSLF